MHFQLLFSFIIFSLARSASSSKVPGVYHDIPKADIDGFNHIFSLFIDPVNGMAKQQILKSGLDPLILNAAANVSHIQDLMICTSNTSIEYTIKDIIGLSDAKLESISVISGEKSSDGSVVLDVMGSILPIDIHANIHGTAFTKCGFIRKTIPFDGTVMAESVKLNLVLESGAIISPTDLNWHTNSTVKLIETDFNRVSIKLKGYQPLMNPILNFLLETVQKQFKTEITGLVNDQVKYDLQNFLNGDD